ncbi:MutS protein msh4 [Spiromyces aspiralis]|uniref:MutS protein msh4 n=1 Tax=Spiromyces aspiralis TaxID=68401 RepID=A0ACC1HWG8_9FUNG|nr:MutS protein msh4 [Spiromyces aspiralis]
MATPSYNYNTSISLDCGGDPGGDESAEYDATATLPDGCSGYLTSAFPPPPPTNATPLGEGSHFLISVAEGRGSATEVGMCAFNVDTNECTLCQIIVADSALSDDRNSPPEQRSPTLPSSGRPRSKLVGAIVRLLPWAKMVSASRSYFSDVAGIEYIRRLGFPEDITSLEFILQSKYGGHCNS